jgi:Mn2+/Fe2+ NRAMP family transporter
MIKGSNQMRQSSKNGAKKRPRNIIFRLLGPGLVTGAADDDPSGIATYSQAGAQFGYGLLWTVFLTTPFMIAIQLISAQIGRVTGKGLAANLTQFVQSPEGGAVLLRAHVLCALASTYAPRQSRRCSVIKAMVSANRCSKASLCWPQPF